MDKEEMKRVIAEINRELEREYEERDQSGVTWKNQITSYDPDYPEFPYDGPYVSFEEFVKEAYRVAQKVARKGGFELEE